jgi:hypothetical protein
MTLPASLRVPSLLAAALLLLSPGIFAQSRPPRTRHALLVSVGRYAPGTGWTETAAANDAVLLTRALAAQGFDTLRNLVRLRDAQATRAGIEAAVADLAKRVKAGDIAVIHVAAHGVQVRDANSDETDGLDEAIAPYDALSPQAAAPAGEKARGYLLDDDFEAMLLPLRKRLDQSGDLLVLLDIGYAGPSGGATARHRGTGIPVIPDAKPKQPVASDAETHLFREASSYRGPESGLAYCAFISAADAATPAAEVSPAGDVAFGALSYAFARVVSEADAGESLEDVFGRMQTQAALASPGCRLVLEAEVPERPVFNGGLVGGPVVRLQRPDRDGSWLVVPGVAAGLSDSVRVAFYRAGAPTAGAPAAGRVAEGQVASVSGFEARLRGLRLPAGQAPAGLAGQALERSWMHRPLVVDFVSSKTGPGAENLRGLFGDDELQALRDRLTGEAILRLGDRPDLLVRKGFRDDEVVAAATGLVIGRMEQGPDMAEQLLGIARRYSHGRMMMEEQPNADLRVKAALVPVVEGQPAPVGGKSRRKAGYWSFAVGEEAVLVVNNAGTFPVYAQVFEVEPDGTVRHFLPDGGQRLRPEDAMVGPGQEVVFSDPRMRLRLQGAAGHRVVKCFFTREPVDLQVLADPEAMGQAGRARGSGFGRLAGVGFMAGNRGVRIPAGAGLARNLHLWLEPAAPVKGR